MDLGDPFYHLRYRRPNENQDGGRTSQQEIAPDMMQEILELRSLFGVENSSQSNKRKFPNCEGLPRKRHKQVSEAGFARLITLRILNRLRDLNHPYRNRKHLKAL